MRQTPAPEFEMLRGERRTWPGGTLEKPIVLDGLATDCAEFEVEFTGGGVHGIELRRSAEGKAALEPFLQRSYVGIAPRYRVGVFLDKRCAEVFVNDGSIGCIQMVRSGRERFGRGHLRQNGNREGIQRERRAACRGVDCDVADKGGAVRFHAVPARKSPEALSRQIGGFIDLPS